MKAQIKQDVQQITDVFKNGRPAFMPYITLGYPDIKTSIEIVKACVENGADMMELGVPFSDPLADGPTIQHSAQVALAAGTTVKKCLAAVGDLREAGVDIPLILMGYYNPILAYGLEAFVRDSAAVGVNGFIVPDLPPEEAEDLLALCDAANIGLVFLLAPNSSDERIEKVLSYSNTFIYLVSVMGITGSRTELSPNIVTFVEKIRKKTDRPLAVGFGISTPEQVRSVAEIADGVIVGSALIKSIDGDQDKPGAAGKFVAQLVSAISGIKE